MQNNMFGGGGNQKGGGGGGATPRRAGGGISTTTVLFALFVFLGVATAAGIAALYLQPATLDALARNSLATGQMRQASAQYYQMLPEILNRQTIQAGVWIGGISVAVLLISASVSALMHKVGQLVAQGIVYERQLPDGKRESVKLFMEHPQFDQRKQPLLTGGRQQGPRVSVEQQPKFGKQQAPALPQRQAGVPRGEQLRQMQSGKNDPGAVPLPPGVTAAGKPPELSKEDPLAGLGMTDMTSLF